MSSVPRSLLDSLAGQRDAVIEYQTQMTSFAALGPDNGGQGELSKALYLENLLRDFGLEDIERVDAPDDRVSGGIRPNIVARVPGLASRTLWIMAHMDVVPPGDLSQWETDPWKVMVDGDVIRGRGVQDNQQGVVCALLVARELLDRGITPDLGLGLLLVSDEETGNAYGIEHVIKTRPDFFRSDDLILVPDFGTADGSWIEVAEKGMFWLRVTITGLQFHASCPQQGKNSLLAAADMILHVQDVAARFKDMEPLFDPPVSTFTPTRHEENVPNINTVPGRDIFYVDCRLLPGVEASTVLAAFQEVFGVIAARHDVDVAIDVVHSAPAAPATSPESEVVRRLAAGIRAIYGIEPHCVGVGGGTVAAPFRHMGLSAAVWGSLVPTAHIANEYTLISKIIGDAQVMATMLFDLPQASRDQDRSGLNVDLPRRL